MGSNRRKLIEMTPDEQAEYLSGRHTMNIATHGQNGRIHLVAMWYGFLDGKPAFETFERSQKVLNLRRNPSITALVETGDTYEELRGLELVGTAEIVEDPDRILECSKSVVRRYITDSSEEEVTATAEYMMRKRVAIVIHAENTVSWDHRKLGGAY